MPCQTLSRQSAPRQPPAWGLGGSLKICALGILRRVRWIIVSSVGVTAVVSKGRWIGAGWLCWVDWDCLARTMALRIVISLLWYEN